MVSDAGLISMSLISLAGMVLLYTLSNRTWFKRQNFKIEMFNIKATNKLQLRKLEREMGLTPGKKTGTAAAASPLGGIAQLLPLLKTLEPEQLSGLVEAYTGSQDAGGDGSPIDILMGFAEDHPEVVQGIIGSLTGKDETEKTIFH